MVPVRRSQTGQGKLGCLLWIAGLAIATLVAVKMVPIKVQTAEFDDFMEEQAKWTGHRTGEDIRKVLVGKANELGLPVRDDNVRVELTRERIKIEAAYTVPVEFPGYTYNWNFHQMVDRPVFIF